MAKIKFGNVVVDMRGKISGNVYSKNRGGAYSRVRVVPINPQTIYQSTARAIITARSQAWKSLTEAQRESWRMAVGNYARINNLGDSHNLSGNALYNSLNANLANVGQGPITTAPLPADVGNGNIVSLAIAEGLGTAVLTLGAAVPADTAIKVYASPAVSAGIENIGTKMRQIGFAAAAAGPAIDIEPDYTARFGAIGAAGSKVFVKIVFVNTTTGQEGTTHRISTIIAA